MNTSNSVCINMCANTNAYAGISISSHVSTTGIDICNAFHTSRRAGHRIHSGISINTNTNIHQHFYSCASIRVGVFLNTVALVCGIDASIKTCINSNMDNKTTSSANICTHIFMLILVLVLVSATLSVLD